MTPENQQQRWIKYGANVVLTSLIVIVLAVVVMTIAQRRSRRFDTTANSQYSLKPQTINIIKDLKEPIRLVSLYIHPQSTQDQSADYAQVVTDLLDEYKENSRNIDVEVIDPVANPSKVDDLIAEVTSKYGGEVKKYKDFVDAAPKYFDPVRQFAKDETAKIAPLPISRVQTDDLDQLMGQVQDTLAELPDELDKAQKQIDALKNQKVPDYKGAADTVQTEMSRISDIAAQISAAFAKLKDDSKVPPAIKQYMIDSIPRYDTLKKVADAAPEDFKKLGDLKLDDLRQKLGERDAILVMGPSDMRSLSFDQVWQADTDKRAYQNATDTTIKPKFSGEQQITSAILQLTTAKKPKVVFLRPSGAPLTNPGFPPFQQGGPLSKIADRLRDYNFDVLEKDLSGQYAMQAQMQGQEAPPEPTDDDIKDAIWVMLSIPTQGNQEMPPPSLSPKLIEHLKQGGSAMCLFLPGSDKLADALGDWGIDVRTDEICVHQAVKTAAASNDMIDEARKNPIIFVLNHFGDHLIAKPLSSLDAVFVRLVPVLLTPKAGYSSSTLIPIPTSTPTWGEHNVEGAVNGDDLTFTPTEGDLPPPLFGGAAVQNDKGGRVVVIGSIDFITNSILSIPDPDMAQRGIPAARFPANAELFCNSIFWLAHLEPLIAISPSAMDINRIGDMSDATLRAWRVGVLLIGLPGAVVLCGLLVYFARRD